MKTNKNFSLYLVLISALGCAVKGNLSDEIASSSSSIPEQENYLSCENDEAGCKIFYTSTTYNGDLGGIEGADAICNADENNPDTNYYYKAFLVGDDRKACTSADCVTLGVYEHVDWVLYPNTLYIRVEDDAVIGTTEANGIWSFPLDNEYQTEIGTSEAIRLWSGLKGDFTNGASNCSNWTNSGSSGGHAKMYAKTSEAVSYSSQLCIDTNYLLCVQQ